jgi:hypothetical protein
VRAVGQPAATDQAIGTGDGARKTFALAKTYGSGPTAVVRPIAKPVAGTVKVAVAGVALAAGGLHGRYGHRPGHPDDRPGGRARRSPPASSSTCRCASTATGIDVTLEGFNAARVGAVALVEVRV